MNEGRKKFGIKVDRHPTGWWSFGICLSHNPEETYLFVNFFKWSISVGSMYFYPKEVD